MSQCPQRPGFLDASQTDYVRIYDLVPEYMRNRAESSVTSDDKLDSLLTNHSEWEIAKNDMIRWGMSGNMLEEKKVEVVQLMQQCRDEGVDGARIREQAAEYENARIRLEEDSESLHSDEQDDYGEDLTTSNNNTSITAREVSRATREYQMLRLKALWGGGKTLIELTREGDIEAVEMLLGARVNPNNIDENERTCLHWTAQLGLVDIAALLIKYGASVDAQAKEGRTPLYMAAVNKHHGMVKLLLQNRADTRATGMNNNFPLHEAAYAGSVECINLLLDVDDSVINAQSTLGLTPLMLSTYATSPKAALCLLSRGAETEKVNNQGMTALAIAASRGNLSTVKVLLRKDPAQLERKDNKGYTPLIHAVMKQRVDVTTFLIGKKADVTAKASDNRSLLSWAALYGSTDLLDILLKEKQDVNAQDSRGFTPLHLAAYAGRWQNVRRLLDPKYRAVITAKTNDGWMPLHEACAKGTLKTVEILLNHGAPIMARDKWQWTPLHRAAQAGHLEIARYLIEQGADIEAKTPYDWTPLHEAIYGGFTSLVSLFLDNDADTAAYDDQGLDALQKAREYKKQDVAELIKRHEAKLGSINATSTTVDDDLDTYDQGPETTTSLDAAKPDKKASKNGAASLRIFPMQMIRYMVGKRLDISIGLVALATGLAVLRPILRSSR